MHCRDADFIYTISVQKHEDIKYVNICIHISFGEYF